MIIDPTNGRTLRTISTRAGGTEVALSADGKYAFIGAQDAPSVNEVEVDNGKLIRMVPLAFDATYIAASPVGLGAFALAVTETSAAVLNP